MSAPSKRKGYCPLQSPHWEGPLFGLLDPATPPLHLPPTSILKKANELKSREGLKKIRRIQKGG